MDDLEIFGRLALAFGIGLLIGVERGWQTRDAQQGTRALGVRSFALTGLLGGIFGFAGQLTNDIVTALGAMSFVALIAVIYVTGVKHGISRGATTEIAAVLTFLLGVIAVRGDTAVAAAAAVTMAATLGIKQPLHGWIARIESDELSAAMKLLVISVVILPVLPNQGYGPGEVINPYVLWWIVVVIAAISFAAYASIRLFGEKAGAALTGLLGGLVSSTATTIAFAKFAKAHPPMARFAAGSIALAGAVMFVRALALTGILFRDAIELLWIPLIAASLTSAAVAGILSLGAKKAEGDSGFELKATADIVTGIKFVIAFVVIGISTEYAREYFGGQGALAASALGGLVDVDATNATMARLGASGAVTVDEVATAVIIAAAVNSIAKGVYAVAIAGRSFAPLAATVFLPPLAVAALALAVERSF